MAIIILITILGECDLQMPGGHIPYLHCIITTPASQQAAVWTESDAINIPRVPGERIHQLTAGYIPYLHRIVVSPASKQAPIWAEGDTVHPVICRDYIHLLSGERVIQIDADRCRHCQHCAIRGENNCLVTLTDHAFPQSGHRALRQTIHRERTQP